MVLGSLQIVEFETPRRAGSGQMIACRAWLPLEALTVAETGGVREPFPTENRSWKRDERKRFRPLG